MSESAVSRTRTRNEWAKAVIIVGVVIGLVWPRATALDHASASRDLLVVSVASVGDLVNAWAAAFEDSGAAPVAVRVDTATQDESVLARVSEADILIYHDVAILPGLLTCGVVSSAYGLLPDLGLRVVDRTGCSHDGNENVMTARAFAAFVASPDGQRVAIEHGALKAATLVTDMAGQRVVVPQPVRRIVTTTEAGTLAVLALGAGDRLLSATIDGHPAALRLRDTVREAGATWQDLLASGGSANEVIVAALLELQPDIVLVSGEPPWADLAIERGVLVLDIGLRAGQVMPDLLAMLGSVLGPNASYRAQRYAAYARTLFDHVVAQVAPVEDRVTVYLAGDDPLMAAGEPNGLMGLLVAAGGIPVSVSLEAAWQPVTVEQIAGWQPDVFMVRTAAAATALLDMVEIARLPAVREGRVMVLPDALLGAAELQPESILASVWIAQRLYPQYAALDCAEQVDFFYQTFYDFAPENGIMAQVCDRHMTESSDQ